MKTYIGVNNLARRVRKIYQGVDVKYTPVDYIQSSGTQYINTLVILDGTRAELDFQMTEIDGSNSQSIFGSYNHIGNMGIRTNNGNFQYAFGFAGANDIVSADLNRHLLEMNKEGKCYFDNVEFADSSSFTTSLHSEWWIYIFIQCNSNADSNKMAKMKVFSCKLYDKLGNLIRDFIPVIDENNVACLFDKVENKFYYNKGTGSFTYGQTTGNQVTIPNQARLIKKGYVGDENNLAKTIYYPTNKVSQNATLLMHLDGNVNDEIGIGTITQNVALTYDNNGKFEKCARGNGSVNPSPNVTIQGVGYNASNQYQNNLTISWWQKATSASTSYSAMSNAGIRPKTANTYMDTGLIRTVSNRYEMVYIYGNSSTGTYQKIGNADNNRTLWTKDGKWHYYAVVFYDNGTWKIFVDGLPVARGTTLHSYTADGNNLLGITNNDCWVDEVYVTREALYTEAFEVPIAPWDK